MAAEYREPDQSGRDEDAEAAIAARVSRMFEPAGSSV